jgi:hypothetical protein
MHDCTTEQIIDVYQANKGNIKATANALKIGRATVRRHLQKAGVYDTPIVGGKIEELKAESRNVPARGVKRYIFTSAQNNTHVNEKFLQNLEALADHYGAEIIVGTYTYNKNAFGKLAVKRGTDDKQDELWYDPSIKKYIVDTRVEIAPGLQWCGEINILPTAENPLSGFQSYTGRPSGIFPHAKIAMDSIPSGKFEGTKFNYTTGTVTQRNYLQKKAGLKAEFHHAYGALLVEVDARGNWYARQLNADRKNRVCDLDLMVDGGQVTEGNPVEAITWGDIHTAKLDPAIKKLAWGKGGIVETLKPKYQFFHDVLDFESRNHHHRGDCYKNFEKYIEGRDDVKAELTEAATLLHNIAVSCDSQLIVIDSNHDRALRRWLMETDYRQDPKNALLFLELQLAIYQSIDQKNKNFHLFEFAMSGHGCPDSVRFLREDESFITCRDASGGIENGFHGDSGPNGSRGNARGFSQMGRKANIAHAHRAGILHGIYTAGVCVERGALDYVKGPTSHSQSNIITYKNGKRAIFTVWEGKWKA